MKLGIKVSHQKESLNDFEAVHPTMCEVWFNASRPSDYQDLFGALKQTKTEVGLHFWGALPDGTWTNLAYPDGDLINQSMALMRQTIDIAAKNGFAYVNIHPGTAARVAMDITSGRVSLLSSPIPFDQSISLAIENIAELDSYAKARNVIFTVETVPVRSVNGWYTGARRDDPKNIHNIYELPVEVIQKAAKHGLWVANDFCHTAANCITDKAQDVWRLLYDTTANLAAQTKLIHLGFILPPFNGTDMHDELDNPLLDTDDAVPNRKQMRQLLKIFQNRDDVWILVEPRENHVKNYYLAKKILEDAGVLSY